MVQLNLLTGQFSKLIFLRRVEQSDYFEVLFKIYSKIFNPHAKHAVHLHRAWKVLFQNLVIVFQIFHVSVDNVEANFLGLSFVERLPVESWTYVNVSKTLTLLVHVLLHQRDLT